MRILVNVSTSSNVQISTWCWCDTPIGQQPKRAHIVKSDDTDILYRAGVIGKSEFPVFDGSNYATSLKGGMIHWESK